MRGRFCHGWPSPHTDGKHSPRALTGACEPSRRHWDYPSKLPRRTLMHPRDKLGLLSLVIYLSGCATSSLSLAPPAPNAPWTPTTRPDGEIVAGAPPSANAPRSNSYILPSNAKAAGEVPAPTDLDRSHPYTLAELIDLAESHNPSTRAAWENAR